ncbi:MAG: transcription termination factor NusA [Methylacidiphilales bacterium]|nr:transcription termination factor NusA [Candidatus Methylacidiphilales bacterium]
MSQEFLAVLEYMEKEKGIDRKQMMLAIEQALLSASRKSFGTAKDLRFQMDPKTGQIRAFATMKVVERSTKPYEEISLTKARQKNSSIHLGEEMEVEVTPSDFGRIAAQVFKQTINQSIRSIEKTMIFDEFKDRVGDVVTGVVRRFERSDVLIDLGKFEAVMPSKERVPTEEYSPNERIRALVLAVESTPRGPQIILSRSHPNFVRRLFELEVNELHDGTVEIKGLAREAGYRTKIAVWSKDEKIDPVGACVGLRGARVKNIVRELNNEKIDLFRWSDNIRDLVIEALKPAKLKSIEVDAENKRIKALVDEENLSLAIGRRGQNARLTAKLTGWEVDISKEEIVVKSFENKIEEATQKLMTALETDHETAAQVVKWFPSVEVLAEAEESDLKEAIPDLPEETIQKILAKARQSMGGAVS